MKIYVASSWRNEKQQRIVALLRSIGHEVYDFSNPTEGNNGFHWSDIDQNWKDWSPSEFRDRLSHDIAIDGFGKDFDAMKWAEAFVLVMPCGRSAHLEAGWAIGVGKPTAILLSDGEPELMYKLASNGYGGAICVNEDELMRWSRIPLLGT